MTKPTELARLGALLAKCLPAPVAPAEAALDLKLLREVCGDNPAILQDLTRTVRDAIRLQIPELSAAMEGSDLAAMHMASHKLMGTAGYIGAPALAAVCGRIEAAAHRGDAAAIPELHNLFSAQAQRTLDALDALVF